MEEKAKNTDVENIYNTTTVNNIFCTTFSSNLHENWNIEPINMNGSEGNSLK